MGMCPLSILAIVGLCQWSRDIAFTSFGYGSGSRATLLGVACGDGSSTAERSAARNGGSMIRSGPSRVDDCGTLVSGRSVASLRCPSPAKNGHPASAPRAVVHLNGDDRSNLAPQPRRERTLFVAWQHRGTFGRQS